jgi:hypothetical protein
VDRAAVANLIDALQAAKTTLKQRLVKTFEFASIHGIIEFDVICPQVGRRAKEVNVSLSGRLHNAGCSLGRSINRIRTSQRIMLHLNINHSRQSARVLL